MSEQHHSNSASIRVMVVDDHAILRDGICSLLEQQPDICVVGEAENGRLALELVAILKPDVVLMDIAMPEMNGMEATQHITREFPQVRVLILTQHDNREYIDPLLRAGASGYVLKRSGGRELVSAIHQVYEQGAFLEPSVARQVLETYADGSESLDAQPHLTERELQVLKLLVSGKSNKEIAHILSISPKTVSVHRSNMMAKLNLRTSFELMRYVTQNHLFDPGDISTA
ncbi:MAG: response regulator transcription factor [Chloroflexota bacterium]